MLIIFAYFALSNINNNLNYFIMKALKKNSENLSKVVNSICETNFSTGNFVIKSYIGNTYQLYSSKRDCIGCSILSLIPSNYMFRLRFLKTGLILTIWYE